MGGHCGVTQGNATMCTIVGGSRRLRTGAPPGLRVQKENQDAMGDPNASRPSRRAPEVCGKGEQMQWP